MTVKELLQQIVDGKQLELRQELAQWLLNTIT